VRLLVRSILLRNYLGCIEGSFYVEYRLSADSELEVRKASINIIADITRLTPVKLKWELVGIFNALYKDKELKKPSLMQLGKFICSLEDTEIPNFLLELYTSLADSKITIDEELKCNCAATFPKVFGIVGMKEWKIFKPMFKNLVKKKNLQVKENVMMSIHKIAQVMGTQMAVEMLDPLVRKYLSNKNRVNICLLNLHEFLKVLNEPLRKNYLEIVQGILNKSGFDWRKREVVASHIGDYIKLFNPQTVYESIFPMTCGLIQDIVMKVRKKGCAQYIEIIRHFNNESEYLKGAFSFVFKLSESVNYKERQSFLFICESFVSEPLLFQKQLLTYFLYIQKDKVMNVRVTLAKVLMTFMSSSVELAGNIYLLKLAELLKEDSAKEVREVMEKKVTQSLTDEELKEKQEELEKVQKMAAESLEQATGDEELEEETKRRETATLLKKTIKVDEIDKS